MMRGRELRLFSLEKRVVQKTLEHISAPEKAMRELERDFSHGYGVTGQDVMASN